MTREALKKDIYERILILQEPRPIIETIKFINQHKKLLDSVMLDKLKLDREVEADEKEATKEVIKGYKKLREKDDPGVFVLLIRLKVKIDSFALADTGSNINVMPYKIYTKLGREEAKPVVKKINMLDYSKAEPMGILRDVRFYVAAVKNRQEEKYSEEEEYSVKRDKNGKPFYGPTTLKYLNYDDPLDRALALQEALNPFKKTIGTHDDKAGSSRSKRSQQHETMKEAMLPFLNNMGYAKEIKAMLDIKVYKVGGHEEIFSSEAWRRVFDINKPIYTELCHVFYSTYDHTLTLLEFARRLSFYHSDEINEEGFEVYFRGGLRSDESFNARDYWLSISIEEELHLSRSLASTIRSPILRVLQKMITYGLCQRTNGYDKMQRNELWLMSMFQVRHQNGYANVAWLMANWLKRKGVGSQRDSMIFCGQIITKLAKRMGLLTDEVVNSLSSPTYCRALDATTLRELIDFEGRLIADDPSPEVPRVAMPRGPHPSMQDIYDRMGNMKIRQGMLERMARSQLYHTDRYAGLFEHMTRHYRYTLQGAYAPPGYVEEQQED
ncbi:hypothetical protein Tco_1431049 [Tanacetum coccineum]